MKTRKNRKNENSGRIKMKIPEEQKNSETLEE